LFSRVADIIASMADRSVCLLMSPHIRKISTRMQMPASIRAEKWGSKYESS
jgi:hypothetical protein